MTVVEVHEMEARFDELLAEVAAGGEVVITRLGCPIARLVPPSDAPTPRRLAGTMKGIITWDERSFDPLPEEELRLWEGRGD